MLQKLEQNIKSRLRYPAIRECADEHIDSGVPFGLSDPCNAPFMVDEREGHGDVRHREMLVFVSFADILDILRVFKILHHVITGSESLCELRPIPVILGAETTKQLEF